MRHLDEGELQAYADDQLPIPDAARAAAHLRECASCRAGLAGARRTLERYQAALDRARPRPATRAAGPRVRRGSPARPLRHAAVLVLGAATALSASLAVPAVRDTVGGWLRGSAAPRSAPARESAPASSPAIPSAPATEAGISVAPGDGPLRVEVTGAGPGLRVRVRIVPGDRLEVRGTGAAAGARFRSRPGVLEVVGARQGELAVGIPERSEAVVAVDGLVRVRKAAGSREPAAAGDAPGTPRVEVEP